MSPIRNGLYQIIGNVWEWCRNPRYTLLDDFNTEQFELGKVPAAGEYCYRKVLSCAIVHTAIDIGLPPETVSIYSQPVVI